MCAGICGKSIQQEYTRLRNKSAPQQCRKRVSNNHVAQSSLPESPSNISLTRVGTLDECQVHTVRVLETFFFFVCVLHVVVIFRAFGFVDSVPKPPLRSPATPCAARTIARNCGGPPGGLDSTRVIGVCGSDQQWGDRTCRGAYSRWWHRECMLCFFYNYPMND